MPNIHHFTAGDVVGFRPYGLGKIENDFLNTEGIKRHGWGPFCVKDVVEDRNGNQLHVSISTERGQDFILPTRWFIHWDTHQNNPERD